MDGSALDMRHVRLCACSPQTVLKKASPVYDGKTRSGLRGGKHALRVPLIGHDAYGMHPAENSVGTLRAGCGRPAEGERIDLLHGLHCPVIVGELCVGHVKLGGKSVTEPQSAQ